MRGYVIAVGSELLGEDRLDTNSLRLSEAMARHGVALAGKSVVGDSLSDLVAELRHALSRAGLVVVSGGLGPTADDLTRQAVAEALELGMHEDPRLVEEIRAKFRHYGMEMPGVNRRQAMILAGAEVLRNPLGTAPGQRLEALDSTIFLFPGVPAELVGMIESALEPWLRGVSDGATLRSASLRLACRSESWVEEALAELYEAYDPAEITVLASVGDLEVRCSVRDDGPRAAERLTAMIEHAAALLGDAVYARRRDADLESVVGELLRDAGSTVVTAESCTGGLIAERLTRVARSSDYFLGGFVTYADRLKRELLGVDGRLLSEAGAVSEEVARAMARGARERLDADLGVAVTGIAGPAGGSEAKPVGTVHVAIADRADAPGAELHRRLSFPGDRERIRRLTSQWALDLTRRRLLDL